MVFTLTHTIDVLQQQQQQKKKKKQQMEIVLCFVSLRITTPKTHPVWMKGGLEVKLAGISVTVWKELC